MMKKVESLREGLLACPVAVRGAAILLSFLFGATAIVRAEVTNWFAENVDTFERNTANAWRYTPRAAYRDGPYVRFYAGDDESSPTTYSPGPMPAGVSLIVEQTLRFDGFGDLHTSTEGAAIGVQLVETSEGSGSFVFAVPDPKAGANAWRCSTTSARTNVAYRIRVVTDYTHGSEYAAYYCRPDGESGDFAALAVVELPLDVARPLGMEYSGNGALVDIRADVDSVQPERPSGYSDWEYAQAIMTWTTPKSTKATVNINDTSAVTTYQRLKNTATGWIDDPDGVWTGKVSYAEFPGYSGTPQLFWHALVSDQAGFAAPGYALRFVPNADSKYQDVLACTKPDLTLGGLIVEPGAKGYQISNYGTGDRSIGLGDRSGAAVARLRVDEDFVLLTGYAKGNEITIFGTVDLEIAAGKSLHLNHDIQGRTTTNYRSLQKMPVVMDAETQAKLRFHGDGQVYVAPGTNLCALGAVTLDYSDLSASRAEPFINGGLMIDGQTDVFLPKDLAERERMKLCASNFITSVNAVMRGREIGGEKLMVTIVYDAATKSAAWSRDLTPTADVRIPVGYSMTLGGPVTDPYVWTGSMAVDGVLTVNGCAAFNGGLTIAGTLHFDGSTLDATTAGRIPVVTLPIGSKIDMSKVVNLTPETWKLIAEDNVLYAFSGNYDAWRSVAGRIVSWRTSGIVGATVSVDSNTAKFRAFDLVNSADTATEYLGATTYKELPGYSGTTAYPFWNVFSSSKGCYSAPGVVLRLPPYASGTAIGKLQANFTPFNLAGLIVEPGAVSESTKYSLTGTSGTCATTLGDPTGMIETWFSVGEDFSVNRTGDVTLSGIVNVDVADGKRLDLNAAQGSGRKLTLDATRKTQLKMHGKGELTNAVLTATGTVTLDFSALDKTREPFIAGALTIDKNTEFAFPTNLNANEKYKICRGTLTGATSDVRFIRVGGDSFYAKLTFDAAATPKTVSYAPGGVNEATVGADTSWSAISWNDGTGWKNGLPAQITLTADARIVCSTKDATLADTKVVFLGAHRADIVLENHLTLPSYDIHCARGATYAYVCPMGNAAISEQAQVVPAGTVVVIEGSTSCRSWNGLLTINGELCTRGWVHLANGENVIGVGGALTTEDGLCDLNGALRGIKGTVNVREGARLKTERWTFLTDTAPACVINVWGELDLTTARWAMTQYTTVNLYAGGVITGEGGPTVGAYEIQKPSHLNVKAYGSAKQATLSARMHYGSTLYVQIDPGVELLMTNPNSFQSSGEHPVPVSGGGTLRLAKDVPITLDGGTCCAGGVKGSGLVSFLLLPTDDTLRASMQSAEDWDGTVWFKGIDFGAFNPDMYGSANSTVRVSGCRGYFPNGTVTVRPALELGETTTTYPVALTIDGGYAQSVITIPKLMGTGVLRATGKAAGQSAIFLPDARRLAGSICVDETSNPIAVIIGTTAAAYAGDWTSHVGEICVLPGQMARLGTNAVFSAFNDISIGENAVLEIAGGHVGAKVVGTGTAKYTGLVDGESLSEVAGYEDAANWQGTVSFQSAHFVGASFEHIGNEKSRVKFSQGELSTAESVVWPREFVLNAVEGDRLFRFTGTPTEGCEDVIIRLVDNPLRPFALWCDGGSGTVTIVGETEAPQMNVVDVHVEYGVDMANATVAFTVEGYDEGYGYTGGTAAFLVVRDREGNAYVQKGLWIDGDGEYSFEAVELRDGRESGYSYEVVVVTRRDTGSAEEDVAKAGLAEFVVHPYASWIYETAATFPAGATGAWSMEPVGIAYPTNGIIRLGDENENPGSLGFKATRASTQPVARLDVTMEALAGAPTALEDLPDDAQAAITMTEDEEAGNQLVFVAWSPIDHEYVKLYGTGLEARPQVGSNYTIRATFDYDNGYVSYAVDGDALTNASGCAFIPLADAGVAAGKLSGVLFTGNGRIAALEGDQLNGNVARVDGVEYRTLDEAMDARPNGGEIELIWDATWHPTLEDFSKPYSFTGRNVTIDEVSLGTLTRNGYKIRQNPDGSYVIDVETYWVTFSANGGGLVPGTVEEDLKQAFQATNMVFQLMANDYLIAPDGKAFAFWNSEFDGSGPSNHADRAEIDMTLYGYTNVTLYACWKTATRTITVASADPQVYLDLVKTNDAVHAGVSFYEVPASSEGVSAMFDVANGTRVDLVFSTDIGKALQDGRHYINLGKVRGNVTVPYADLPKLVSELVVSGLSPLEQWAYSRGVTPSALKTSSYKASSYGLDVSPLLDDQTVVTVADFTVTADGCSFRVLVNGEAINNRIAIVDMIHVSNDLVSWQPVDPSLVAVEGETVRVTMTESGKFVKIVVPRD